MQIRERSSIIFPSKLPVFPLSGALLLPGGRLPLNIFEKRYLNLVLDALAQGRMFGMIQPNPDTSDLEKDITSDQELYKIGCLGKIVYFEEADDGRFLIALKGLSRFSMVREEDNIKGYRVLEVNYDQFADDVLMDSELILDRSSIFDILPKYLDSQGLKLRIDAIEALSDLDLILTLSMICPFNTREKQALLESKSFSDRADMLLALLQMGVFGNSETDEVFQ